MYIYLITNNNKDHKRFGWKYIGQRSKEFDNDDNYWGSSKFLSRDIKKLGKENFTKEILINSCIDKNELDEKEIFYISKYNTYLGEGYNQNPGGSGGDYITNHPNNDKIRKKMSNSWKKKYDNGYQNHQKGKKYSEERKKQISIMNTGEKNGFYGKTHTERTKQYLSDIRSKKPVLQYSLEGEFIKEWKNANHAGLDLNLSPSDIYNCCTQLNIFHKKLGVYYKTKKVGNFTWFYKNEFNETILQERLHNLKTPKLGKKLGQYDMEGNLIKIWPSVKEAERVLKAKHIRNVVNKKNRSALNSKWFYLDENKK